VAGTNEQCNIKLLITYAKAVSTNEHCNKASRSIGSSGEH
jgi:hypothetical protein